MSDECRHGLTGAIACMGCAREIDALRAANKGLSIGVESLQKELLDCHAELSRMKEAGERYVKIADTFIDRNEHVLCDDSCSKKYYRDEYRAALAHWREIVEGSLQEKSGEK